MPEPQTKLYSQCDRSFRHLRPCADVAMTEWLRYVAPFSLPPHLLRTIVEPFSQLFVERREPFRVRDQELAGTNLIAVFGFR
jgi:hypothetical protein